jgi:hypothetical protein
MRTKGFLSEGPWMSLRESVTPEVHKEFPRPRNSRGPPVSVPTHLPGGYDTGSSMECTGLEAQVTTVRSSPFAFLLFFGSTGAGVRIQGRGLAMHSSLSLSPLFKFPKEQQVC